MSHLTWIIIAAAAVTGELAIQLSHQGQMEQFAAPVVSVPAFHVLTAADVRPLWRPASQIPPNAIRSPSAIVGHVTLANLAANQRITASELGQDAVGRKGGLSVVGVPATAAMALDGELMPGQTVEAIAASTGRTPGYTKVLVLSVTRTGSGTRPYVVVLAFPARTPEWMVAAMGAGSVTLASEPAS